MTSIFNSTKILLLFPLALTLIVGCASSPEEKKKEDFFTSGSPAADRRAAQSVSSEKEANGNERSSAGREKAGSNIPAVEDQVTLFERLGGTEGIRTIVDDFMKRVLEDPRVNWSRKGVANRGWFRTDRAKTWEPTPENVNRLKLHMVQFIALATGGPSKYDGKPIRPAHAEMQITKAEFDATIGDLKATLDKLNIKNEVQKDLLSIFESTRSQIVVER